MFAKMVSMAKSAEEVKEDIAEISAPMTAAKPSTPKYPWGLCLSLEDETLSKLGIDGELPKAGDVIQFTALAKVTNSSTSESETTDGATKECRRVELQITDMGVPAPDMASQSMAKSEQRRKRFYPAMVADTDNDGS